MDRCRTELVGCTEQLEAFLEQMALVFWMDFMNFMDLNDLNDENSQTTGWDLLFCDFPKGLNWKSTLEIVGFHRL